ncbi:MAG TPA: sugar transferase [Anaerolineales bacterium]|nr:sugar transferase [Anaerolineales bacterium]
MSNAKNTPPPKLWRLRPRERQTLLILGDFLMASTALTVALIFWSYADIYQSFSIQFLLRTPAWFFGLPFLWPVLMARMYEEHRARSPQEVLPGITLAAVLGLGIYLLVYFTSPPNSLPRIGVAVFIVLASVLTLLWRLFYIRVFTAPQFMRRLLLVGAGETGTIMLKILNQLNPRPYVMVGLIDDDPLKINTYIEGYQVLGGNDILLDSINKYGISDLIVAISGRMQGSMFQALLDAQEMGIDITRMPVAYEELLHRVPIRYLEAEWIVRTFVDKARGNSFYEMFKRLIDIAGGLFGVFILIILFPFISLAIYLETGRPIIYTQARLGKGGQQYHMIKFRTMRQDAEPDGQPKWAEENDRRATRVGKILRKTHLDEIPQFINVLRGEMSLVGPRAERPELVDWFQYHVPFYRARLLVKPGITGWAQVNQDYAASVDETIVKLEYDLYYITHRSFIMDLQVMLRTPMMVLGLRGR